MKRLASVFVLFCLAFSVAAKDKPNIVLIMADDLGYADIGCYGSDFIKTPHIDALAANGLRFTDYHSNGAVCSPTRAALMTGRYPQRTGVEGVITVARHREVGLPLEEVTIAEVLKDAGYSTAMFGKWHLGYDIKKFGPQRQGFETFEGFVSGNVDYFNKIDQEGHKDWYIGDELKHVEGYVTDLINDGAVDWIGRHTKEDKDKPFFLYLAHGAPHYPLQGPDGTGFREVGKKKVGQRINDPKAVYKAMIESMDAGIGRVVAKLKEHGLDKNTLVIFCSDNGQAGRGPGSAGVLRGSKGTVYEGGHRVPMVLALPNVTNPGLECTFPTVGMDLLPTLAKYAGAKLLEGVNVDGVDVFERVFSGRRFSQRDLHWVHGSKHAMRQGPWKLVINGKNKPELYNLTDDISEKSDLADEHPEKVEQLRKAHEAWLGEMRKGVEKVSG